MTKPEASRAAVDASSALPEPLRSVRERPGMWLPTVTFDVAVAYLAGFDAGVRGGLLIGFREWLVLRMDGSNNLVWWALAQDLIAQQPTVRTDHQCVDALFALLEAFCAEKNASCDFVQQVFVAHDAWLERKGLKLP